MFRSRMVLMVVIVMLVAVLAACAPAAAPEVVEDPTAEPTVEPTEEVPAVDPTEEAPDLDQEAPLVILERVGGLCVYGACGWRMTIDKDGNVTAVDGRGEVGITLSAEQMEQLRSLIAETDFEAIKSVAFTETCPIAYDGQQLIYTLQTEGGEERIDSCEVVVDPSHPLFLFIEGIAASLPEPTEAPVTDDGAPLVIVEREGGLCVAGACQWTMTIYESGKVTASNGQGAVEMTLSAEQIEQLRSLIAETDFEAIKAVAFTDTCPIAYDGQKSIYTVQIEGVQERIDSCEVVVDPNHPLFLFIEGIAASLPAIEA